MPVRNNLPPVPPVPNGPRSVYKPSGANVARGNTAPTSSQLARPTSGTAAQYTGNATQNPGNMGPPGLKQNIMMAPVWNPSQGPSPSIMPPSGQNLPANQHPVAQSAMSVAQPTTANDVCKTYNRDRNVFRVGEILSLPFHEPNTNPTLQPQDFRLRLTHQGPVFTKRRMVVILWIHRRDMFCLPLYSFEGKGLNSKSPFIRPEYVCLRNFDDKNFNKQGNYPPVVATYMKKPFDANTAVHITGGMRVQCVEDIAFCGRLMRDSYNDLVKLWEHETKSARQLSKY